MDALSDGVPDAPDLDVYSGARKLAHYLKSTADLLLEQPHALTVADRDAICAAADCAGRHLIWVGQRVPGYFTGEPVTILPPDLPSVAAGDGPAAWVTGSLRLVCESLRTIGYGLDDCQDDDGQFGDQAELFVKQTLADARSRLDHLLALAAETPFSDEAIAEVSVT